MKISPLQVVEQKYWSGLTRNQHLAWTGLAKGPAVLSEMIDNLYELNYGDDNLVSLVDKYPTLYVDQEVYEWMLKGTSERNIPLVKATYSVSGTETDITSSTTAKVGENFQPFYLYFAEKWFSAPSVLGGLRPEDYLVKITGDPVQVGTLWKYPVQMYGASSSLYMPLEELTAGVPYGQMFAPVEREFSKRGSDIQFASFFKLQNTISTIRKSYQVPGSMIHKGGNVPLAAMFQDDDGKKIVKWIDYAAWEFYKQMRRDKARLVLYGKSTVGPDGQSQIAGESGNPVIAGFGLYEQMQGSNLGFYNNFNLDALTDFAMKMSYNKIPEDKRKFVISTGQFGLYQFHKAASLKASTMPWLRSPHNFKVSGNKVELNEGQIMSYISVNGIEFHLIHDPMLDSPITAGKIPHPNGGYVSSYIYNIWDFGTDNGEPNIQKVAIKGDEEYMRYVPGLRDPFTPGGMGASNSMAAHGIDTYEVHKMINCSIRIKNPLRTARYMPNIYKSLGY